MVINSWGWGSWGLSRSWNDSQWWDWMSGYDEVITWCCMVLGWSGKHGIIAGPTRWMAHYAATSWSHDAPLVTGSKLEITTILWHEIPKIPLVIFQMTQHTSYKGFFYGLLCMFPPIFTRMTRDISFGVHDELGMMRDWDFF